jgi:hypothetical protein
LRLAAGLRPGAANPRFAAKATLAAEDVTRKEPALAILPGVGNAFSKGTGANMKLAGWVVTVFVSAVSMGAGVAAAQVAFESLPKVMDASMPRDEQMSIALSACPEGVAGNATVYVLGANGYEVARQGSNGASSLVGRHFVRPDETTIEPMCFSPEGSKTMLQTELYGEELRSKGTAEAEIKTAIANGYKEGRFKAPGGPGALYMLSTDNRLGPTPDHQTVHFPPHFMFFAPYVTGKDLGYESAAPFLVNPGKPDAMMVVVPDLNPKKE